MEPIVTLEETDPGALERAVEALAADGVVVVKDAVDRGYLASLKTRMDEDTTRLLAYCARHGGNPRDLGHLQQGPPPFPPYLHASLLAHPLVWAVARRVLGPEAGLFYYSGNTNCPGSGCQKVHLDQPHPHDRIKPISTLVVNVPVQATSAANGAIEIWPGPHTILSEPRVPEASLEARREERPPLQLETEMGDVVLRDARTWHRGVTNPSEEYRHLVGAVLHARPSKRVPFDHSAKPFVDSVDVHLNPVYADLTEEYLFGPTRWLIEQRDGTGSSDADRDAPARPLVDI